jgi:predicted RNase H-like HicB family nuclease
MFHYRPEISSAIATNVWMVLGSFRCKNSVMKRPFAAAVWREGDWYVSQCLEVDIASQGETEEKALDNLKEALELHFEPPQAIRPPKVRAIEVEVGAA